MAFSENYESDDESTGNQQLSVKEALKRAANNDDSFHALLNIFTSPEPSVADPESPLIPDLSSALYELITEDPLKADAYASTLQRLATVDTLPQVADNWRPGETTSFSTVLARCLHEEVKSAWTDDESEEGKEEGAPFAITPKNRHLLGSLFCAAITRSGLVPSTPITRGKLSDVLHYRTPDSYAPNAVANKPTRRQSELVGGCIMMVAVGSKFFDSKATYEDMVKPEVAATLLEKLIALRVLSHPGSVELLKTAHAHAKAGFTEDLTLRDTWSLLF